MYDIAYLEFAVEDRAAVVDYFTRSFGFDETAVCAGPERTSTLLRQGSIRLVVSSGPDTEDFVAEHGDGISDIAFCCVDVPAAVERAVAAGVPLLGPAKLSGFGGVCHTLIEQDTRADVARPFPDGRPWVPLTARPRSGRPAFLREVDHIAVLVESGTLRDVARFYEDGFDLKQYSSEYVEVGAQAMDSIVVRSGSGKVTFTIIEPDATRKPGQIDGFLERNRGAGVQHLAFLVDDIIDAVRTYRQLGIEFLATPDAYYAALTERVGQLREQVRDLRDTGVLADRDEWGYLLQLFTRSPHPRNTLFHELIQRRGAHGFGSANIRALYESVERERDGSHEQ